MRLKNRKLVKRNPSKGSWGSYCAEGKFNTTPPAQLYANLTILLQGATQLVAETQTLKPLHGDSV